MILVDTSVWVEHLHRPVRQLEARLMQRRVAMHPFVLGELVCGNLPDRSRFVKALRQLPQVDVVDHDVVFDLIESKKLMGLGIGWVDAHLLASVLQGKHHLCTLDKRLAGAAQALGVAPAG